MNFHVLIYLGGVYGVEKHQQIATYGQCQKLLAEKNNNVVVHAVAGEANVAHIITNGISC